MSSVDLWVVGRVDFETSVFTLSMGEGHPPRCSMTSSCFMLSCSPHRGRSRASIACQQGVCVCVCVCVFDALREWLVICVVFGQACSLHGGRPRTSVSFQQGMCVRCSVHMCVVRCVLFCYLGAHKPRNARTYIQDIVANTYMPMPAERTHM